MKKRTRYLAIATLAVVLGAAGLYRLTLWLGTPGRLTNNDGNGPADGPDGDPDRITITPFDRPTGEGNVLIRGKGKTNRLHLDLDELRDHQTHYVNDMQCAKYIVFRQGREKIRQEVRDCDRPSATDLKPKPGREETLVKFKGHPELDVNEEQGLIKKCLMITDLSVVEDPVRTAGMGPWTFGALMRNMANQDATGIQPGAFVRRWLEHWETDQGVNSFIVPNRCDGIQSLIIEPWERASGGQGMPLDLTQAPFRLLAIVNRLDLRDNLVLGDERIGGGGAGEVHFVFCAFDMRKCDFPVLFTVIFEFQIKRSNFQAVRKWANRWYALKDKAPGEEYNAALQEITDGFTTAGADRESPPDRSALSQLRTNEIALAIEEMNNSVTPIRPRDWELREFRIDVNNTGYLRQVTVKQAPDAAFNDEKNVSRQTILAEYINAAQTKIRAQAYHVPLEYSPRGPFLGGAALMPAHLVWNAPDIADPNARHLFSLATCNGCHAGEAFPHVSIDREDPLTDRQQPLQFLHVRPRQIGAEAELSPFLIGKIKGQAEDSDFALVDPVQTAVARNKARTFSDLSNRAHDLAGLVKYGAVYEKDMDVLAMPH